MTTDTEIRPLIHAAIPDGEVDGGFEHINRIEAMRNRLAAGETTFTLDELKLTLAWADHLNYFRSLDMPRLTALEAEKAHAQRLVAEWRKSIELTEAALRKSEAENAALKATFEFEDDEVLRIGPNDTAIMPREYWDNAAAARKAQRNLIKSQVAHIAALKAEVARLSALLNTPELIDFTKAVQIEAAHQRERWGDDHDKAKAPSDWIALLIYLLGKAVTAQWDGNRDKYLHHIITVAAVANNWHSRAIRSLSASGEQR